MGLFILETNGADRMDAPGTAYLEELSSAPTDAFTKRAPGHPELILVPTPSDDAADPLNWSFVKREAAFATLLFNTALAGVIGPLVAPAFVDLITDLNEPLQRVVQINGSLVFAIGVGSVLFTPLQTKYGSRPTFILATLLLFVSSIWCAASTSYVSLIAARTLTGLSMGPFFSGVPSAIVDMYFVHQRGSRMSCWNLALIGGINIGPVISSQIIDATSWRTAFWCFSAAAGAGFVATVLLLPETVYDRSYYTSAILSRAPISESVSPGSDKEENLGVQVVPAPVDRKQTSGWQSLLPFSGSKTPIPLWRLIVRPLAYLLSPAVIFGSIVFSVTFNLLPILATVYAQIFTAPPFNFKAGGVGLIGGVPPLVGTLIGTFLTGPLSDYFIKTMSIRNDGVFEPEMRLMPFLLYAAFGGAGAFGWAATVANSNGWPAQAVMIASLHIGISAGTIACFGYVSELAGSSASDALGMITLVKSFIGFGIIFFVNEWLASQGLIKFLNTLGALVIVTSALAVPMWVFGKRTRLFSQRRGFVAV